MRHEIRLFRTKDSKADSPLEESLPLYRDVPRLRGAGEPRIGCSRYSSPTNQKLAVLTDLVMPGWAPYRGWGNADYPPGMLAAHDAILAVDFDTYVGGHVYRTGTRADVEQSREFFLDLWNTTAKKMGDVSFADATQGIETANACAAQAAWMEQVSADVTAELVDRWGDTLAGVDTFTPATVAAAVVSISTDNPKRFP